MEEQDSKGEGGSRPRRALVIANPIAGRGRAEAAARELVEDCAATASRPIST
ncbi:MAG: hypothetical protein R3F34_08465 [Planctomycetota bacterium]